MDFVPVWLDPADVKAQLRLGDSDVADDDLVTRCAAAVEPQVERARPDLFAVPVVDPRAPRIALPDPDSYEPDAEVYQAAVMLAARLVRRRNSPAGIESFAMSVTYVSRYDPDIARALHADAWAHPAVG
jgi:hypothetical protein